jgi:hypothetical protein
MQPRVRIKSATPDIGSRPVIHQAIWLYLRFTLSFRDVEDLLAERGIAVSHRAPLREPLRVDDRRVSAQAPSKTACDLAS